MRSFNSIKQASEYVQQNPKKDASESALNWLLAGTIAAPEATLIGAAGYVGDRLFHDAVQAYNGEDIDKNGMWVYNPGGWLAGYGITKIPQASKVLYDVSKIPHKTYKNAKDLYYGFQHGDIHKISTNPLLKQILDNSITEQFLTKTQPGKRTLETIMRTTPAPNPIPEVLKGIEKLPLKPRINYIVFGKNPKLRKLFKQPNMHYGDNSWSYNPYTVDGGGFGSFDIPIIINNARQYTGLVDNFTDPVIRRGYGDIIDAYLYGTPIDPKIASPSTTNAGLQFFKSYTSRNYPNKKIKSYTVQGDVNPESIVKTSDWSGRRGIFAEEFRTNDNSATINVAGHNVQNGWTDPSSPFPQAQRGFDIWKFNPEEYNSGWNIGNNYLESRGLELIDKAGTPIIFEQPWKLIAR